MSKKFLDAFLGWLQNQVANHSIYVWGAQGEKAPIITEAWIKRMETSTANANRAIAYWKKQVAAGYGDKLMAFDCSGMIVYWLMANNLLSYDTTAQGLRGLSTTIKRANLRRGDWVFRIDSKNKAYHVGVVVDDQLTVIEAMGRDAGVVKRGLTANGANYWNAYGRPSRFFGESPAPEPVPPLDTLPPTIIKTNLAGSGTYRKDDKITLAAYGVTDASGIDKVEVIVHKIGMQQSTLMRVPMRTAFDEEPGKWKKTIVLTDLYGSKVWTGEWVLRIKAYDNAGNSTKPDDHKYKILVK